MCYSKMGLRTGVQNAFWAPFVAPITFPPGILICRGYLCPLSCTVLVTVGVWAHLCVLSLLPWALKFFWKGVVGYAQTNLDKL